ncbi:hypothetical protein [Paludisphaera soli]|uniref:hypothetical protein n=1 Tax=Paludisphaera soli TaxID=2712865 RepID=UPI0013EBDFD3|nr:hypothetical protein [Paludisphaera soli]
MDSTPFLRPVCLALAALAIIAGGLGMLVSLLALSLRGPADVIAGASGFVAGAILVGSGLVSLTMLATRPPATTTKAFGGSEID